LIVKKPATGIAKTDKADFSKILAATPFIGNKPLHKMIEQEGFPETEIQKSLFKAYENVETWHSASLHINNTDRAVGATLAGKIALKYGDEGLPDDSFTATFHGSAGQSFGAFLAKGMTFHLKGEANDYLGKGLSGGKIIVTPAEGSTFDPGRNVIAGNTLMYGATSGEVYINGRVGERFCVRNSGAKAVVEGTGEHCCEYMTGGRVVVLGYAGRNFGAGMSGGAAYVWNKDGYFDACCNMEMVELSLIDNRSDSEELMSLIEKHYHYTASPAAKLIIDNPDLFGEFIKITPIEYKKVLQEEQMRALQQKIAEVRHDY